MEDFLGEYSRGVAYSSPVASCGSKGRTEAGLPIAGDDCH